MEAGVGVASVSSVLFLELLNIRNFVHMVLAVLQLEEVLVVIKRGRKGEKNMLMCI